MMYSLYLHLDLAHSPSLMLYFFQQWHLVNNEISGVNIHYQFPTIAIEYNTIVIRVLGMFKLPLKVPTNEFNKDH